MFAGISSTERSVPYSILLRGDILLFSAWRQPQPPYDPYKVKVWVHLAQVSVSSREVDHQVPTANEWGATTAKCAQTIMNIYEFCSILQGSHPQHRRAGSLSRKRAKNSTEPPHPTQNGRLSHHTPTWCPTCPPRSRQQGISIHTT